MRLSHWLRPLAARLNRTRTQPISHPRVFRPRVEGLEDRTTPSAPGEVDLAFGTNGVVTTDFNATEDGAYSVAVQPNDGKLIIVGHTFPGATGYDSAVARYNADGTLDNTFGNDPSRPGRITIDFGSPEDYCNWVTVLPNGQILLVGITLNGTSGRYELAVNRLNNNGALDTTFGGDGRVTIEFGELDINLSRWNFKALLQGDKIIVSGGLNGNHGLVRLNGDGSVDNTFGCAGNGRVVIPVGGIYSHADAVVQPDGKIVVAGEQGLVLRLDSEGRPDSTFVQQTLDFTTFKVILDRQGNILLAGRNDFPDFFQDQDFAVARLNGNDGSLDPTFGTGGEVRIDFETWHEAAGVLAVQADGRIVVQGGSWSPDDDSLRHGVARLNADGSLDASFGFGGRVLVSSATGWFGGPVIHPDGGIFFIDSFLQSDSDFVLIRMLGLTDADGDGIDDFVDPEPAVLSNTFSDGTTTGSIISRGDQILAIVNALDPAQGVVVTAAEGGGTTPAEIRLDGGASSVFLSPGDRVVLTRGSIIVHVLTGTVEALFVAESGAVATADLSAGNTLTFRPETAVFLAAPTNTQPIVVSINGTVVTVNPGATITAPPLVVRIDVRLESLNLASQGVIPIVLFGAANFDVTRATIGTIRFAGAEASQWSFADVNGDGRLDLVLHFRVQDTNLRQLYEQLLRDDHDADGVLDSTRQTARVALTGQTQGGESFEGFDAVDLSLSGKALRDLLNRLFGG